jgi:hypothetical protein
MVTASRPPRPLDEREIRVLQKQASRDADAAALASGSMSRDELAAKNVFLRARRFEVDFDSAVPLR